MWGQPNSIFRSFRKDLLGKCDVCFRAGFCIRSECDAEKALEKTLIDNIITSTNLHGIVDNSIMSKLVGTIINYDKKLDFKKYEKSIIKQIKKVKTPKKFNTILSKLSISLRSLSDAKSKVEFNDAVKNLEKAIVKIKTAETIKKQIQRISSGFKRLVNLQDKRKESKIISLKKK